MCDKVIQICEYHSTHSETPGGCDTSRGITVMGAKRKGVDVNKMYAIGLVGPSPILVSCRWIAGQISIQLFRDLPIQNKAYHHILIELV